jgi:phosphatidylinositol alpha 1,6-mannosyltransferase
MASMGGEGPRLSTDLTDTHDESLPELRVALFTGNYNYIKDGVALSLNRLVAFLLKRGVAVLVFAPAGPVAAFEPAGELVTVPSMAIPGRSEYRIALGFPAAARQRLADFRPTLIHIAVPDILGYKALRYAKRQGLPVVASFHTRYDKYFRFYGAGFLERIATAYLRWFYKRCLRVYPPSSSMADIIRQEGMSEHIEVWARGVDSGLFSPARRDPSWRRSLGIGADDVVINFTGRLVKEKNTDLAVRVLTLLKKRGVAFRALFTGDGPEKKAMQAALPDALFPGFLHGEELARAYASSDIFFFPSESETFGNVTLEAMASGLPAVNALASGSKSLVVPGETGFIEPARDAGALADRLESLVHDGALRSCMGERARQRALTFSWDAILAGLLDSYRQVLVETGHGRGA